MAGARGPAGRQLVTRPFARRDPGRGPQLVTRLFGRRNRRRGPQQRDEAVRRVALRVLTAALAVGAAVAVGPWVTSRARSHPYFAVQEVVVRGNRRLAPDALRRVAAIEPGTSIWDVDCDAVVQRIAAEPWVRTVRVRREMPHRVLITVREERPTAILATSQKNGAPGLYYVAARGHIFAPVHAGEPRDFPYVTGLAAADLDGGQAFGPRAIRRALGLLRVATRTGPVSEVHIDRTHGLTLLPVRPTVPIALGWTHFADRLALLPPVMSRWAGREAEIAGVSLEFDDQVIVRTRTVPKTPPPPARRAQRT